MAFALLLFLVRHYGLLALLTLFSYLIGARLTHSLSYSSPSEKFSFCTGLGLSVIAYVILLAGIFQLLTLKIVLGVFAVISIFLAAQFVELVSLANRFWSSAPPNRRICFGIILLIALPALLLPLYPPTQWDAISYHLAVAKIFSQSHAVVATPYLRVPVFPQVNEMLFTLMLMLYDDVSAQLVQFLTMFLVAMALYAWGSRLFSARAGLWSAVLWLSNPLVVWLGSIAYVDVGSVLFVVLAVYAFFNWFRSRAISWLAISAGMFGVATGAKYSALAPLAGFALFLLYLSVRERRIRDLIVFVAIAATVAGPWYLRIFHYTGNPVWPALASKLGYGPWTTDDMARQFDELAHYGVGKSLGAILLLPWNLARHSRVFHGEYPLSPAYLGLIPLCIICAIRDSNIRALLVAAAFITICWFETVQVLRYLLAAVPLLSLAAAGSLEKLAAYFCVDRIPKYKRAIAGSVCILLAAPAWAGFTSPGLSGALLFPSKLPPATPDRRAAYLEQALPMYPSLQFLNRLRGANYRVYTLEYSNMAYFADGEFIGDWFGPARYDVFFSHYTEPDKLYQDLRGLGANYLLIHATHEAGAASDTVSDTLLAPEFLEGHFKLIYAHSSGVLFELVDRGLVAGLYSSPELLKNRGFEDFSGGQLASWTFVGKPTIDISGSSSHEGRSSVYSDPDNYVYQPVAVTPGTLYLLRQFTKSQTGGQYARLQIHWLDRNRAFFAVDSEIIPVNTTWQDRAMAATAPEKAFWAVIYASAQGESKVWFDDLSFREIKYK